MSFAAAPPPSAVTWSRRLRFDHTLHGFHVRGLEIRATGAAGGPTFAFVPGMASGSDVVDRMVPYFDPHWTMTALELPWSGQQGSTWGLAAHPREWARLALESITPQAQVIVAHSFGANALLEYLSAYGPGSIAAAVLISPFYKPDPDAFDWPLMIYYIEQFERLLAEGLLMRRPQRRRPPDFIPAMARKVRDRIGSYGWLEFFRLFSGTPALDLASITIPCLVIGAEHDFAAFPEDCRALGAALPEGSSVEILTGCGHFSMLEKPDAVAAAIRRFLGGNTARKERNVT